MKILSILVCISLSYGLCAQKALFVRVYNLEGKKIHKGRLVSVSDTSLQLRRDTTRINIPVSNIGFLKTKRAAGHNVLIGSLVGASAIAILGAVSADPDALIFGYTAGEGAAAGALYGLPIGAAIGGFTLLFKNSKTYFINGEVTKWKALQSAFILKKQ